MTALQIALRETRKLQADEIKRGQLHFDPPTDDGALLTFWAERLMNKRYCPRGIGKRELRVESQIWAAVQSGELTVRDARSVAQTP